MAIRAGNSSRIPSGAFSCFSRSTGLRFSTSSQVAGSRGRLDAAREKFDRALALDGSSAWAWGRSGWIKAYAGEAAEAIEHFQIARALAPADPLNFLCSVGVAAGHFWEARYDEAARWFERALAENPAAVWINHTLTPAYAFGGRKEQARQSLAELTRAFPGLTIAQVRFGLPYRSGFLDRIANGLESVGMRAC